VLTTLGSTFNIRSKLLRQTRIDSRTLETHVARNHPSATRRTGLKKHKIEDSIRQGRGGIQVEIEQVVVRRIEEVDSPVSRQFKSRNVDRELLIN